MKPNKLIRTLVAGAALAVAGPVVAQQMQFFKIASGAAGGTYFPMAGILSNAISNPPGSRPCDQGGSCGVEGLVAIAMSANGSVANVNSIQSGAVESGFVQSDVAYWAYTATGLFEGQEPMTKLRVIANLFPEHIHVLVRKDSPFHAVTDLKDKRLGIGLQASGAKVGAVLILEAHGMKENVDYQAEYLNSQQSVDRMRDGQLESMLTVTGYPQAAVAELFSTMGGRLIPVGEAERRAVQEVAPFYGHGVIPATAYEGMEGDVETLVVGAQWLVSEDVADDLVYEITKALWNENTRRLFDSGHAKGREVKLDTALDAIGIPVHPGAARFYEEQGLTVPKPSM